MLCCDGGVRQQTEWKRARSSTEIKVTYELTILQHSQFVIARILVSTRCYASLHLNLRFNEQLPYFVISEPFSDSQSGWS